MTRCWATPSAFSLLRVRSWWCDRAVELLAGHALGDRAARAACGFLGASRGPLRSPALPAAGCAVASGRRGRRRRARDDRRTRRGRRARRRPPRGAGAVAPAARRRVRPPAAPADDRRPMRDARRPPRPGWFSGTCAPRCAVSVQSTDCARPAVDNAAPRRNVGNAKGPARVGGPFESMSGCVLLSHTVTSAVPSALKGLASGFGMEPGVSPSL